MFPDRPEAGPYTICSLNRNLHSRNDTERAQGSNDLKCTEHALAAGTAGR